MNYRAIPLLLCFPFLHSLLLPIRLPLLTWNPPCCDRIRPPRSQVARKLIFPLPSPCSYTPHSKIPTPRGFLDPNIHSLGRHRESGSQAPEQLGWVDDGTGTNIEQGKVVLYKLQYNNLIHIVVGVKLFVS